LRPYFEIRLLPESCLGKHEVDGGRVDSGSDGGRPAFSHNEIEGRGRAVVYDLRDQAGASPAGVDDALGGRPEQRGSLNAAFALHQQVVRLRRVHAAAEGTSITAMPLL
jgi:hypothetical protein